MTVQQLLALAPTGGAPDLPVIIEALREQKAWQEANGASRAFATQIRHGGPAARTFVAVSEYEDYQSLGKALDATDRALASGEQRPLAAVVASDPPLVTIATHATRSEITPSAPGVPEPASPRAGVTAIIRPNPGGEQATLEAIAESQRHVEGLGGHVRVWAVGAAGESPPTIHIQNVASGWEALGRLLDQIEAAQPGPLVRALQGANPPATLAGGITSIELPLTPR